MSSPPNFPSLEKNADFASVRDISPTDVLENLANLQIIDVRQPDEFTGELGHIEGAALVVLDSLPQNLDKLSNNKPIVFICRSGMRSARAADFALQNGFSDVYNMKGGMLAWKKSDFPKDSKQSQQ